VCAPVEVELAAYAIVSLTATTSKNEFRPRPDPVLPESALKNLRLAGFERSTAARSPPWFRNVLRLNPIELYVRKAVLPRCQTPPRNCLPSPLCWRNLGCAGFARSKNVTEGPPDTSVLPVSARATRVPVSI